MPAELADDDAKEPSEVVIENASQQWLGPSIKVESAAKRRSGTASMVDEASTKQKSKNTFTGLVDKGTI